ncbi:transposase [Candidatus Woesearchaeota archaeon]|nr:transposase [Candidatus Woesearchaeota archaeon]
MTFIRKIKKKSGTYLAEVKSYRENGKIKQKVIRYLGKEVNGKPAKKITSADIKIKNVKRSLDVLAIDKLAEQLTIKSINNKYLLSLIYSQLLEKRSINKLEEWMEYTEIPEILKINNLSTKNLYESLTEIPEGEFINIDKNMHVIFNQIEEIKDVAVIDVTDTYFEGKSLDIKKRKGKDGKVRRLVQIGLATSFTNGFPIFHKQYQGNLPGVHILKDMSLEVKEMGLNSIIMDRGMMSLENLKLISSLELSLIAGLRKNNYLIENFIYKIDKEEIYSLKNMVRLKNTKVFIKTFDYLNGKLIAVYNPSIELIKKNQNFEKGFDSSKDLGFSLIFHNTNYSPEEVVKKYYEKEIIERAFKQMKGILNLRPIRVWLTDHIEGHIKICYLAYAILSLMNYKLKKLKVSAIDALDSLKYGYKVKLFDKTNNFEWDLIVPLKPKQKDILGALGVVYKN